ncbi:MAG: ribonuclease Z [archaeon]
MEIVFLGTSSMIPTKDRNHTAIALIYKGELMLFDCGEGTQRQIRLARLAPSKLTKLFITHWHGDHVLGIPGLVQTLGGINYENTLEIFGPQKTKEFINKILNAFLCENKINILTKDVTEGKVIETDDYQIKAIKLEHGPPTLAYSFEEKDKLRINLNYLKKFGLEKHPILKDLQQGKNIKWNGKTIKSKDATTIKKGKKICIILDTGMTAQLEKKLTAFAKDADILIMETTFGEELADKAKAYGHLHVSQAAKLAKKAKVKKLFLTHFSQRYRDVEELKVQATKIFKNTECAKDLLKIEL